MMSDQAIFRPSAVALRAEARALLDRLPMAENPADRRELAKQAFELVRQAEEAQPFTAEAASRPDESEHVQSLRQRHMVPAFTRQ
jgi:hypothetical protein